MNILGMSFNVIDNSGVTKIFCIGLLNKNIKLKVGIIIIGVVKSVKVNSKIKLSTIVRALIVKIKNSIIDEKGVIYKFNTSSVVLVDKYNNPLGTRIFGNISYKNLIDISKNLKYLTSKFV